MKCQGFVLTLLYSGDQRSAEQIPAWDSGHVTTSACDLQEMAILFETVTLLVKYWDHESPNLVWETAEMTDPVY
jgi:hypothetical protein